MLKLFVIIAVGVALVLGLTGFSLFGGSKSVARESRGPFEIETQVRRISAGGFPNTSGNPFERTEVTEFRLYHRGKLIEVDIRGNKIDSFWEARFLENASRPTVLLAITGLWLVSEENGTVKIELVKEPDTSGALIQWLDGAAGQPAKAIHFGIRDARGEPRGDSGGTLLLLGRGALLDVRTLTLQHYRPYQADDYSVSNADALRLSPQGSQYVMLGQKLVDDGTIYAMVVAEPGRQRSYAIPFDYKATRLIAPATISPETINPAWFDHHFTWSRDASGAEKLIQRTGVTPFPRLGRLVKIGGNLIEYHLGEATPRLQEALQAFLVGRFNAKVMSSSADDSGDIVTRLNMGVRDYNMHYVPNKKRLILSFPSIRSEEEADVYAHLKEVGETFNAVLATGKHRELFADFRTKSP